MDTLDFRFAPFAALACFVVYLWLLKKFPTGVVFIGFTTYGIAWVKLGPLNYAMAVFSLQLLSATIFTYWVLRTKGIDRIAQFFRTRYSLFLWFIFIVWVKITFEILYTGMDEFRLEALKIAAQTTLLPALIFFMAAVAIDPWRFSAGIMIGMVAFALAFVIPTIPGMLVEGRLTAAFFGSDRLTIYNMDTINGGRFFFMGALGSMTLLAAGGLRRSTMVFLGIVFTAFVVLLLLNGTRQFVIGVIIAGMMCFYSLVRTSGVLRVATFVVAIAMISYLSFSIFQTAEVGERFSGDSIASELALSRGAIWSQALKAGMENPFTGVGFRQFGDIATVAGQSGESENVATLSGAHGFFQDICAEHGVVLAMVGLGIFFLSIWFVSRCIQAQEHSVVWAHFAALLGMVVPLFMSGYVFGSSAMYLFAGSMYVVFAKHKIDLAQQHVIQIEAMREAAARKKQMDILKGRA